MQKFNKIYAIVCHKIGLLKLVIFFYMICWLLNRH